MLSWTNPEPGVTNQAVRVQARNALSVDEVYLNFNVRPTFFAQVTTQDSKRERPSTSLIFNIKTLDWVNLKPAASKRVVFWVKKSGYAGQPRKIYLSTNDEGSAVHLYQPCSTDAGHFTFGCMHPNYANNTIQGEFAIRAVDIIPTSHFASGLVAENITLTNAFHYVVEGGTLNGPFVRVSEDHNLDLIEVKVEVDSNNPAQQASLSLTIRSSTPLSEILELTLFSEEGDEVHFCPCRHTLSVSQNSVVDENGQCQCSQERPSCLRRHRREECGKPKQWTSHCQLSCP